ncbi:hypothetical protein Tco_1347820 [Tanacetum coccineum]
MTAVGQVNERVTDLAITQREMRYFRSMASSCEREAVIARQAWSRSEDRSTALEASIRTLEAQVRTLQTQHDRMEWQGHDAGDLVTTAFGHIHALEAIDIMHCFHYSLITFRITEQKA